MGIQSIYKILADKFFDTRKHNDLKQFHATGDKSHLKNYYSSEKYAANYEKPKAAWINKFKMFISLMDLQPGQKVLDIGCTTKMLKPFIEAKGAKYYSFDISSTFKPDFLGDVENMNEITDKQFDWVVAADVIEHVPNPQNALNEIHRISKRAVISVPNWDHFDCLGIFPANPYDRHLTKQFPYFWLKMIRKSGFKVHGVSGYKYTMEFPSYGSSFLKKVNGFFDNRLFSWISKKLNKSVAGYWPMTRLGQTFIVVVRSKKE